MEYTPMGYTCIVMQEGFTADGWGLDCLRACLGLAVLAFGRCRHGVIAHPDGVNGRCGE